jgi:hypothetical protein
MIMSPKEASVLATMSSSLLFVVEQSTMVKFKIQAPT